MLLSNTVFRERYKIIKKIAESSHNSVYLAFDLQEKINVVIKEIKPFNIYGDQLTRQSEVFFDQIEFLKTLGDQNIVTFFDAFFDNDFFYYVTEWVDGTDLEKLLNSRENPLEDKDAVKIFYELVKVLNFFNTHEPVINLEYLKLTDIMIDNEGRVKLVDLGSSILLQPEYIPTDCVISGEKPGQQKDIFIVGALAYQLLTKEDPESLEVGQFPIISKINPQISRTLANIIHKSVDYPDYRYRTIRELRQAIMQWFPEYTTAYQIPGEKSLEEEMKEKDMKARVNYIGCLMFFIVAAILSVIYYSDAVKWLENRNLDKCSENLIIINQALEEYKKEKATYPDELTKLIPEYLKELPLCPSAGGLDVYAYKYSKRGNQYIIYCKGNHHKGADVPENYPMYSSYWGLSKKPPENN